MARLETLIPAALVQTRETFITEHLGFHLLKPPVEQRDRSSSSTTVDAGDPDGAPPSYIVPSSSTWQAAPIVKRPGNSFPNRISVGRALNSDIVLRFPVVSTLHAHFTMSSSGALMLQDLGSSNGTWHNGRRITLEELIVLGPRDLISFGGVHCEVLDASGLYDLVSGIRH